MGSPKVLFVAADALDPYLLREGVAAGRFPTFARLLAGGVRAPTRGPLGLYIGAIWPSLATGASPARHRAYSQFEQFDPETYRDMPFVPERLAVEPFWGHLSRAGRRVAIVDFPLVPLSPIADGVHIVDWGSHDPVHKHPQYWPAGLEGDVTKLVGPAPVRACDGARTKAVQYRRLHDGLASRAQKRVKIAQHLLRMAEWDFFACVFTESHCAGHQLWHLHDPSHPLHDRAVASELGDPLLDVYAAIDRAVGELLAGLDDRTTVIFLASHGMGPHYDASFMLDSMLLRLENRSHEVPEEGVGLARSLWRLLPLELRQSVGPAALAYLKRLKTIRQAASRKHRRFFAVPNNDAWGAIRINVGGRDPHGCVRLGVEYDALCTELRIALMEFVNADTGTPVVKAVHSARELYHGPFAEDLPDLLIEWHRDHPIRRVSSPRAGSVTGRLVGTRSGDHRPEGLFTMRHPRLGAGDLSREVDVMDIAPTVTAMLGLPVAGFDGVPVREVTDPVLGV
jgi:predicted AlkP superfamily phosphohydrolase/phosphomutase